MNLMAASFAPGALIAAIMCFMNLPAWAEILAFIVVSVPIFILVRPIFAKAMYKHKKQMKLDKLIGSDAVVICEIYNAHGIGVVNIGGREYKAKSHKPNARISEGSKVKVVTMRGDIAIVDDLKRTSTGRIEVPKEYFKDDYLD